MVTGGSATAPLPPRWGNVGGGPWFMCPLPLPRNKQVDQDQGSEHLHLQNHPWMVRWASSLRVPAPSPDHTQVMPRPCQGCPPRPEPQQAQPPP